MSDADDPSVDQAVDDAVDQAADTLYAARPEEFLATRTSLAAAAKADGATDAARRIGALRKPTAAASLVNRLALTDASVLERIVDLGDRLREAHDALDPTAIRELTTERRTLVAGLTRTAAKGASTAVRDEVSGTFDAAVADPSVAERLGRLTKAERWSGFGLAPAGPPSLTVVRGGRSTARTTTTKARTKAAKAPTKAAAARGASAGASAAAPEKREAPPAAKARLTRALTRAQEAFDTAEADLTAADGAERAAGEQVRTLTAELAQLQRGLEAAKQELDAARRAARAARTRRREARSALDRAERNKERG